MPDRDPIALNPSGPHSPEATRRAADLVAEGIRYLNYATRSGEAGLESPGDAYSLLGALYTATERLPQLLRQLTAFLAAQGASGILAEDHGRDVATQIAEASYHLGHADGSSTLLTAALQQAQQSVSGLYVMGD